MLEYTYDFLAAPVWNLISSNVFRGNAGSGSYTWSAPETITTRCYVRVSDADNALIFGNSPVEFSITNGIQVYTPTGGETYYLGQTVDLAWASSPAAATNVQWALSTDGVNFDVGNGAMVMSVAHTAGGVTTNAAGWLLDAQDPGFLTTNGQLRVSGTGLREGRSGGNISVLGLVITHPASDSVVLTGSTCTVEWTGLGAGSAVDIRYSDDGGSSFTVVSNGVANVDGTNAFAWVVPLPATSNAVLEISSQTDTNIVARRIFAVTDNPLAVNVAGDGIPDDWKIANGLDTLNLDGQSGAYDDPDGDGSSNEHEWLAGTDPLSSTSVFGILSVEPAAGDIDPTPDASGMVLRWRTVPGRRYVVESSDSLGTGWTNVSGMLEAAGDTLEWTDTAPVARRFYRIGTIFE